GAAAVALAPLAGQLDGALVGLGAAVAEEHVAQPAGLRDQRGQPGHRRVVEGGAAVDEARGLLLQRAAHDGVAVAQAVHRPALDEVEILAAVAVAQPRALPLDHRDRRPRRHLHHVLHALPHGLFLRPPSCGGHPPRGQSIILIVTINPRDELSSLTWAIPGAACSASPRGASRTAPPSAPSSTAARPGCRCPRPTSSPISIAGCPARARSPRSARRPT